MSYRRWLPVALLAAASLLLGLSSVDREGVAAVQRGDALAAERRYSEALDAYGDAARRCPGCPQPHLRRGAVYVAQGRHAEAWAAYLAAVRLGGDGDAAQVGKAQLYAAQGAPEWAIDALHRLLARRPQRADLWLALGETHLAQGERREARAAFERALGMDLSARERQAAHDRLGTLCLGGWSPDTACLEPDLACAAGHLGQAALGPDPALAARGRALIAALDQVGGGEEPALARAKLGEALLRHGETALARCSFQAAVDLEPAYVDGHAYLGHALSLLGQDEAAVAHLARAIDLEPTYPLPYYLLGMHHARRGRWITARDLLVQAHDLDPANPAICAAVAETYVRASDRLYAAAERWLHAAVDNAPHDARFHLLLAHFYVDEGIDPGQRGLAAARVAVDLAPTNAEAQETLGWAYHLAGRSAQAIEPLTRAHELAPEEARVSYRLGEVYRALGQAAQARRFYQQAVDLDWHGPVGERARRAMGKEDEGPRTEFRNKSETPRTTTSCGWQPSRKWRPLWGGKPGKLVQLGENGVMVNLPRYFTEGDSPTYCGDPGRSSLVALAEVCYNPCVERLHHRGES